MRGSPKGGAPPPGEPGGRRPAAGAPPAPAAAGAAVPPFACPNCDGAIDDARLYCTELCQQEANFVRYVRACRADGREEREDVREAIAIKLAMILAGGYPEAERRLSAETRAAVIARDRGLCRACGSAGTDIDHIKGSSDRLSNLQLLCRPCHNTKTTAGMTVITAETHPEEFAHAARLYVRIDAEEAVRPCDREDWNRAWRAVVAVRRAALRGSDAGARRVTKRHP